MNKTKSKVLSLILASAMIVSSFSSLNFASAATRTEAGELKLASDSLLNDDDELFLVSDPDSESSAIDIEDLIGTVSIETYDKQSASTPEFDRVSHVKGDKIVTVDKDGNLKVRRGASGKEVINVRYEAEYTRDDDKDYTVKADKDITIYADEAGEVFLGEYVATTKLNKPAVDGTAERPGDVPTVAVNEQYMDLGAYYAEPSSATGVPTVVATYQGVDLTTVKEAAAGSAAYVANSSDWYWKATVGAGTGTTADDHKGGEKVPSAIATFDETTMVRATTVKDLELKNSKVFTDVALKNTTKVTVDTTAETAAATPVYGASALENYAIRLKTTFVPETTKAGTTNKRDASAELVKIGSNTLKIKLGTIDTETPAQYADYDGSQQNFTVSSEKKWNADIDLTTGVTDDTSRSKFEINKNGGKTYLVVGSLNWDDKDAFKNQKDDNNAAQPINSYDKVVSKTGSFTVIDGTVGNLEAKATGSSIKVEDGTVGDIKADLVTIEDGSVGTIKDQAVTVSVEAGKVKAIDAEDATVDITGGDIAGDVTGATISIDAEDDDVNTVIGGKVTAKADTDPTVEIDSTGDATVTIKGAVKGEVTVSGDKVTLNNIDADYQYGVVFEDFTGSIKAVNNVDEDASLELKGESVVTLSSKLVADSVEIEEDSKLTVSDAELGGIDGDGGIFAFPAGKLYVKDDIGDVKLVITDGLVAGATAFTSDEGQVDGSDLTTLGFTLETKSQSKTIDKHVIKDVKFAGVKFDKTELTIAKGHSDTVTVANYPAGTALPAGYSVEWNVDVNDDYITVTTEGNVATVKAVDYSSDRAIDNQGTISATVVDADGYEVEDLLTASINVTAIEKPASVVTLDTTKPVTLGTGAVYQYIAKSSTAAVLSAASSDTQIATVELFNAADPRGYKFQVKGVAEGTATITTTDANGATATLTVNVVKVNGTLKADTTTYTFAPGKVYDVKFSTTGTTAVPVVTVNGKVVSIAPRGNGVYRVTAQNPGTAFVVATVGNTHVSVKFVVANGAASVGVKGNNVSTLK